MKPVGLHSSQSPVSSAPPVPGSDEWLIARARTGDRGAFGELWRRHAHAGIRVAKQFTSSIDADDLVAEAYTRIYSRTLAGGGPLGAFRPYLYTTIRNIASRWGQSSREIQVDDLDAFEDPHAEDDPAASTLNRTMTADAFRTLPERWQAVLWYTEVEAMDPREVAPLLGISANGVAALSYRAREGLRKAWLQAHVSTSTTEGECRWVVSRLGEFTRNGLSNRERTRANAHLEGCAKCSALSHEVDEVGSQLAMALLPLIFGVTIGGTLLAAFSTPTSASAASLLAAPALPAFLHGATNGGLAIAAPVATVGAGAAVPMSLVGTVAIALVLSGGLAVGISHDTVADPQQSAVSQPYSAVSDVTPNGRDRTGAEQRPSGGPVGVRGEVIADQESSSIVADLPAVSDRLGVAHPSVVRGVTDTVSSLVNDVAGTAGDLVSGVGGTAGVLVQDLSGPLTAVVPSLPELPTPSLVAPILGALTVPNPSGGVSNVVGLITG